MNKLRWMTRGAAVAAVGLLGVNMMATAAFAQTATATPSAGLTDGQVIEVDGTGYDPNFSPIQILECDSVSPADQTHCDGTTLDTQAATDSTGAFFNGPNDPSGLTVGYTTHKVIHTIDGTTDCSVSVCALYAGENKTNFGSQATGFKHAFVQIAFAPTAQVPESPINTLLPISGALVLFGGGYVVFRRRRTTPVSPA